jgi:hypothetical protein
LTGVECLGKTASEGVIFEIDTIKKNKGNRKEKKNRKNKHDNGEEEEKGKDF